MLRTLLMAAGVMVITFLLLRSLYGLFFNVPLLVMWILLGVLCIGAGKVRLHYHAYLKAASRDDAHARGAMASELTMIHGVPPDCDEREFLRELQTRCCGLTSVTTWRRCSGSWWADPGGRYC